MIETDLPEFDYMETVWVTRQDVFEAEPEFIVRVFPLDQGNILQCFFRPHKFTLLHRFIAVECEIAFRTLADNHGVARLVDYLSFYTDDTVSLTDLRQTTVNWYQEYLSASYDEIIQYNEGDLIVDRIPLSSLVDRYFYILFTDRFFLFKFNDLLTNLVKRLDCHEHRDFVRKNGKIKRPANIPKWLQKGIIRRDQGRCVHCGKDLTNVYVLEAAHYDHIIPLDDFGTNDPVNFQLLCQDCNLSKSSKRWKPPDDDLHFW
jgi:hypothetical protein